MKKENIKLISVISLAACLFGGCASAPSVEYNPLAATGKEACKKENKCVIETDKGKTFISISKKSAVSISSVHKIDKHDIKHHDFLISVKNISDEPIEFEPTRIPGYDEEALVAKLQADQNAVLGIGIVAILGSALLGGDINDMTNMTQIVADGMDVGQVEMDAKKAEFSSEKFETQFIAPKESASGRIVLKASDATNDKDLNNYITVAIPVGTELHLFEFEKEEVVENI